MSSGIGPRKRSDPKYDNEEYIAEMEAKLFRTIAPGEETCGVTSRNEKKFGH